MTDATYKEQLRRYFDGEGFARWEQIYGDAPLSRVRTTIRAGHTALIDTALAWLGTPTGPILDAGCGTGLLTVALAQRGWQVSALDLAPQMAQATAQAATRAGVAERVTVLTGDLDAAAGRYASVACLDVLVHYSAADLARMVGHLAQLTDGPLLFSYAPLTPLFAVLHRIGGWFPKRERRTTIQMVAAADVERALAAVGRRVTRQQAISSGFYHVTLVESKK